MPVVLTDLEQRILDYMVRYLRTNTYQPSIREIGEEFAIKSTKTVSEHLQALAEKGYLERDPSRSRGVRILGVDLQPETISVPCYLGFPEAQAGLSSEGIEAYLAVDRRMAGAKGSFFVRIRGSEFQSIGAAPGDLLMIEPLSASDLQDGDLAVVRHPGGPQPVRYVANGRRHFLRPGLSDDEFLSATSTEDPEVLGRIVALHRRFESHPLPTRATAH